MRRLKLSLIIGMIVILMAVVLTAEAKTQVYDWKMVSAEVSGDPQTEFSERYAKLVEERSEGRIKITVYPFGTLGQERDLVELIQLGEIELGAVSYGWLAGFVPATQVFSLQYLWPKENTAKVLHEVSKNGKIVDLLKEKFKTKGLQLLCLWSSGGQMVTSNVPIRSPEDCKGLKHRVMASPILVKSYNSYGFNAQSLDYGEVYGALQTKLIDSQVNPISSIWSMGFYEVQDYGTNLFNEFFVNLPIINYNLFNSLPEDLQQIVIESAIDLVEPMTNWCFERETKLKNKIKEVKPTFTFYDLTKDEIVAFSDLAWKEGGPADVFLKIGGKNSEQILNTLLADINIAKNK